MSVQTAAAPEERPFKLPWPAMAAALVACAALFEREQGSFVLPILVVVMLASYVFPKRLGSSPAEWGPWLIVMILPVFLQNLVRAPTESPGFFDPSRARYSGEGAAAVLAMECWRKWPDGGGRGVISILLSALILMAGTSSFEESTVPTYAAAYAFFLLLALFSFRSDTEPGRPVLSHWPSQALVGSAVALALLIGFGCYSGLHTYRSEVTDWAMKLTGERLSPKDSAGLSDTPSLGSMHGSPGGMGRVLRIQGDLPDGHLRGHAYADYGGGKWLPSRENRRFVDVDAAAFSEERSVPSSSVCVTRLANIDGVLVMPLTTVSLGLEEQDEVRWAPEDGGPVHAKAEAPCDYTLKAAKDESYQGILCVRPSAADLVRLKAVPAEVGQGVRDLSARVLQQASVLMPRRRGATGALSRLEQAQALEMYLMQAHPYSLRYAPGPGDPITNFLMSDRGAHCEYFAAGLVMLLRCAGIPARYVVGYYAHEGEGSGSIVVRQRDAHAWAEAWIEGTGWITIDATPASGMPDQTGEKAGWWTRLTEWFQDRWADAKRLFGEMDPRAMVGVLVALVVLMLGSALLRRKRRQLGARPFSYSDPAREIADLRARFEAACLAQGWNCPPNQPWSECVASLRAPEGGGEGFDAESAAEFVRLYNAARFGEAAPEMLARLRALLDERGGRAR